MGTIAPLSLFQKKGDLFHKIHGTVTLFAAFGRIGF
ncbi:hypothetical protein P775_14490 [Puniceibacterium antarcticum]|uniref:Uncharacterized protein n=1 Tax=Puniceibacterium antarcticum TaxID=1206336 RepID=A0A2G8RCU6_9RHOB|nr:hypothetical protein P775_14490 [Puniceibacterium antarcticum]